MSPPIVSHYYNPFNKAYGTHFNRDIQNRCVAGWPHDHVAIRVSHIMQEANAFGYSQDYATEQIKDLFDKYPGVIDDFGLKSDYLFIKKNIVAPSLEFLAKHQTEVPEYIKPKNDKQETKFSWVSTGLDFVPIFGTIKGFAEGIIGKDLAGNELVGWERIVGMAPYAKYIKKSGKVIKGFKAADAVNHSSTVFKKTNKATDASKAIDKGYATTKILVKTEKVSTVSQKLYYPVRQLQKKYDDHAEAFGVYGNYNKKNALKFEEAIKAHVNSPDSVVIHGLYNKDKAIHIFNPKTKINVMYHPDGKFWSGWELNPKQLFHMVNHGKIGGHKSASIFKLQSILVA